MLKTSPFSQYIHPSLAKTLGFKSPTHQQEQQGKGFIKGHEKYMQKRILDAISLTSECSSKIVVWDTAKNI